MIRIATLHAVAPRVRYHKCSRALTEEEKAGEWVGAGCTEAGLEPGSAVAAPDLESLLRGFSPSGRYLGRNRKLHRRAGWDVVVSVHKSISVAALCLDENTRKLVKEAYDEAVREFPRLLDSLACRQNAGLRPIDTGNVVAAAFTHLRSRHNDPHLHTHFIVMNATLDRTDTRGSSWRSLEIAPVFRQHKALDLGFNRELLRALHVRGVPAEYDHNGRAMLPVISAPLCSRLSRANQIIKEAAVQPRPEPLATLHEEHYRNLLNDRLRPPKSAPGEPLTFMILPAERQVILTRLQAEPKPTDPGASTEQITDQALRKLVSEEYHKRTLFYTPKALFRAIVEVARRHLMLPWEVLLAARDQVQTVFTPSSAIKRQVNDAIALSQHSRMKGDRSNVVLGVVRSSPSGQRPVRKL